MLMRRLYLDLIIITISTMTTSTVTRISSSRSMCDQLIIVAVDVVFTNNLKLLKTVVGRQRLQLNRLANILSIEEI